jgi:predicted phage-related endonuclease
MSREQLAMNLRGEYEPYYSAAMKQGNDLEDMVRTKANDLLQELFMPMVAVKDGYLASLDGLNFDKDTLIEIKVSEKTFNDIVREDLPKHYLSQIHHQMMVVDTVKIGYLVAYNPKTEKIAISEPIKRDRKKQLDIKLAWRSFEDEKDTLSINESNLSEDKDFLDAVKEFKESKSLVDEATVRLNQAKEKLQSFHKGVKTFGGGVTISLSKDSKSIKYADIYKDNKTLFKDVDLSKYESIRKGSFRIVVKDDDK